MTRYCGLALTGARLTRTTRTEILMELPRRPKGDTYLPDGALTTAMERLRSVERAHELRIGIVSAFDFRTRMLPYWYADKRMAPCSVRTLTDVLFASGFRHIRTVLQQWTPRFQPSRAVLDGRPLDLLLVSAMQVHAEPAYDLIRDAHQLGDARPLVLAGGPKAIYEPSDYLELGPRPGVGADCVVTGEAYVLLDLLETVFRDWKPGEHVRATFDRVRGSGALNSVPGLVYLSPDRPPESPVAVNTGVQRLLRDLDEMPVPDAGYRLLEPPHRGRDLRADPLPAKRVKWTSPIASIVTTQGCKFACPYCPIPAVNQRTWRHKSPERFAAEIKHIYEEFGITCFFGTDDNYFNKPETVAAQMQALAETTTRGTRLGKVIKFYTEATQFDVYRNRDLLPLCRKAGLRGIWFGIEDLTATLVRKGQSAGPAAELFDELSGLGIEPHIMMIHSDEQPLRSPAGTLDGLLNQVQHVRNMGAVSYQCTYLGPAVGTKDLEPAAEARAIFKRVEGRLVPQAHQDGNHVVSSVHSRPWRQQMNLIRAYIAFYNPLNTLRALWALRRGRVSGKQLAFQLIGQIGLLLTVPKMWMWARRLKRGPIERWQGAEPPRIPMIDAHTAEEMNWAIGHAPTPGFETPARVVAQATADVDQVASGEAIALPQVYV